MGDTAPDRVGEVKDRRLRSIEVSPAPAIGSLVSLVSRENTPFLGSHWKYLFPETDPSFFPFGSSSTTPAQSPGAKCVSPMYAMCPGRSPPTQTRWPMIKLSVSVVRTTPWSAIATGRWRGIGCYYHNLRYAYSDKCSRLNEHLSDRREQCRVGNRHSDPGIIAKACLGVIFQWTVLVKLFVAPFCAGLAELINLMTLAGCSSYL